MRKFFSGTFGTLLMLVAAGLLGYFGNLWIQSYLGHRAIENTGLRSYSISEAKAVAKKEDKLILVDVSAVWCSSCRKLDNEVFSNEKIKSIIDKDYVYSRLELETPEGESFLNKRGVKGVPNLWILDSEGEDIKRLAVTFDPKEFAYQLRR